MSKSNFYPYQTPDSLVFGPEPEMVLCTSPTTGGTDELVDTDVEGLTWTEF
ncbi:MAG: hypothetical protein J5764_00215 [Bacteroidales bacterium]|nr:hypothetical protein [Bacteroidales bacterium]